MKGVAYLTHWQPRSLFRRRHGTMSHACCHITLHRNGGRCLVRGRGWRDPFLLLLLWVHKSWRRQWWNQMVGKGKSRWGRKPELHVSRFNWQVCNEGWSFQENQVPSLCLILQIFWYKLPFSIEEVTLTSPWWVTSIKICKWARFCLTLCFLGTDRWHIHLTVQKMLCFDLSGSEAFQVSFQS